MVCTCVYIHMTWSVHDLVCFVTNWTDCLYSSPVHAQTLTCQVNGGVVSCPPVACPGDQVTFTSTVLAAVGSNIWLLPSGTCSAHGSTIPDSIALTQTAGRCKGIIMACGPYTATNADLDASNPCLTSTLSVTATSSMTSSVIQVGTRSVDGQNTIVNTTQIMIIGKKVALCTIIKAFHTTGSIYIYNNN